MLYIVLGNYSLFLIKRYATGFLIIRMWNSTSGKMLMQNGSRVSLLPIGSRLATAISRARLLDPE